MNEIFQEAQTLEEAKKILIGAKRRLKTARQELASQGCHYAELIAHAHSFAGAPDEEANHRGGEMLRAITEVLGLMDQIYTLSAKAGVVIIQAGQALDESQARRRHAGSSHLKI